MSNAFCFPGSNRSTKRTHCYGERASKVQFSRARAALEISVDGRNGDLVWRHRYARACSDASAATRIDEFHANIEEQLVPTLRNGNILDNS